MNNLQIQSKECMSKILSLLTDKTFPKEGSQASREISQDCISTIDATMQEIKSVTLPDFLGLNLSELKHGVGRLLLTSSAATVVDRIVGTNSCFSMPSRDDIIIYYFYGAWTSLVTDSVVYKYATSIFSTHYQEWENFKKSPKNLSDLILILTQTDLGASKSKIYVVYLLAGIVSMAATKKICNLRGYKLSWKDVGKLAILNTISRMAMVAWA